MENLQSQVLRDWLHENEEHVVLRIGLSKTSNEPFIDLPFQTTLDAHEAMEDIDLAGIHRVQIFPKSGPVTIWANYVIYCRIIQLRWCEIQQVASREEFNSPEL